MIYLLEAPGLAILKPTRSGKETPFMAPESEPRRHWIRILFVLPFIALLWVSSYNRLTPELFGFPFYYWY